MEMKQLKLFAWGVIILFGTSACGNKSSEKTTVKENKVASVQIPPETSIAKYNDRMFFFLKGNVKEMTFSLTYAESMLIDPELNGMFRNMKGVKVRFSEAGLLTRLTWEDTSYDYTLDAPDENGNFAVKGDPALKDVYYYVPQQGNRNTSDTKHFLEIELDQLNNGEVTGNDTAICDATFSNDGKIDKLYNSLFSYLGVSTDCGGTEDYYEYAENQDRYPSVVHRGVICGGDTFIFNYNIEYTGIDEQGNWTKAEYSDVENGSVQITIIRALSYY